MYPSKYLFWENIHLFNDVIHVYSWLVSWKKRASVPILMNFSCWECADDGCLGTMVSLLIGLLYASLQLPLDNRENKNSRNVCLSQIRENIFPRKFLLIQYSKGRLQSQTAGWPAVPSGFEQLPLFRTIETDRPTGGWILKSFLTE